MSRIKSALKLLFTSAAASFLLAGCLTSTLDERWGEAYQSKVADQIADPEAARIERPGPRNLDPETAARTAERYYQIPEDSFGGQQRGPVIEIGEGGQVGM